MDEKTIHAINVAALDILLGIDGMPSEDGFEKIYSVFEKIIKGGAYDLI